MLIEELISVLIAGKTRTKEKYRVVYTDHQRLELEKEFHFNRYITIRRKAELAVSLGLSERQVMYEITCHSSSYCTNQPQESCAYFYSISNVF